MNTRELLTKLSLSPSTLPDIGNEGFWDDLQKLIGFKTTSGKPTTSSPHHAIRPKKISAWGEMNIWLEKALANPNAVLDNYTESDSHVIINSNFVPYYLRGGRQVTDILKEVMADTRIYNELATKNMPQTMKIFHFMHDAKKQLNLFTDKYPQGDAPDEYMKMMASLINKQPKSVIEFFKEPTTSFLGYGRTPFVLKTHKLTFSEVQRPHPSNTTIVLPRLNRKGVEDLLDNLNTLYRLAENTSTLVDTFPVIDFSDQPTRAYIRDLTTEQDKQLAQFKYAHQDEYDNSLTLYDNIGSRAFHLALAYAYYLKKSLNQ